MAYTFGAGTGDDIVFTHTTQLLANLAASLVCGWFYPTTLTATRGLWSAGNTIGAEIDTTTSELRFRTDNTTDGQWTTSGAGLVVNEWRFIAMFGTSTNTGPAAAWRCWTGSLDTAPEERTVSVAVSPSGNFTGSGNFYLGNKGTGTLAFQGDIGRVDTFAQSGTTAGQIGPFTLNAYGVVTNDEAENIYRCFVLPVWKGEFPFRAFESYHSGWEAFSYSMDNAVAPRSYRYNINTAQPWTVGSVTGATKSLSRSPRAGLMGGVRVRRR